ncbi:hypothetical protein D3C85_1910720 [compost metagenome]
MVGGDQLAFPLQVALGDRQPQCLALDQQAGAGDVANFVGGNTADAEALLFGGDDEAGGGRA